MSRIEINKRYRNKLRAAGLCNRCGKKVNKHPSWCDSCHNEQVAAQRERRRKKKHIEYYI